MTPPEVTPDVQMASYVMGLLSEPENTAIERKLREDGPLRDEYFFWLNHFEALNAAYQPQPAPVPYAKVAQRLFGVPQRAKMPLWLKLSLGLGFCLVLAAKIEIIVMIAKYLSSLSW